MSRQPYGILHKVDLIHIAPLVNKILDHVLRRHTVFEGKAMERPAIDDVTSIKRDNEHIKRVGWNREATHCLPLHAPTGQLAGLYPRA